jgi:hypothetical protein
MVSGQRPLSKESFCRPFRAVHLLYLYLGLKPQAESCYPFGISTTAQSSRDHRSVPRDENSRAPRLTPISGKTSLLSKSKANPLRYLRCLL